MSRRVHAALAIALVVVLAGCLSTGGPTTSTQNPTATQTVTATATPTEELTPTATATSTPARTPTATPTETPTETATPTATPEPTPDADNPWGTHTITVSLHPEGTQYSRFKRAVREAVAYWNEHDDEYGSYQIQFNYVGEDVEDPDLKIVLKDDVTWCGSENPRWVGCAPFIDDSVRVPADYTVNVTVESYSDYCYTYTTAKHELGHVLGIEHGEEPMPTMAAEAETGEFDPDC